MRRALRASTVAAACTGAVALSALAWACTTFNGVTLPPEQNPASDAATDSVMLDTATEAPFDSGSEAAAPRSLLSLQAAARVCALAAKCPYLAPSVQGSIAVPIDPTNFSLCMHWL